MKDCKIPSSNLTLAECDLIFVQVLKSQQQVFNLSNDATSKGQIGPSSFIEIILLLFLKKQGELLVNDEIDEFLKRLHAFLRENVSKKAKFIDNVTLSSKLTKSKRVSRVILLWHHQLATTFRHWAGSTWKGPPLKNWQKSMNVNEWMQFLKDYSLLEQETGPSQSSKDRSKRVAARTAGAENLNTVTSLTEDDMIKNIRIRQVSQMSARQIFQNACGGGKGLDLKSIVDEAGSVKGRHHAEKWDLLSFYDSTVKVKRRGADDAATQKIVRGETLDTRAWLEAICALAEYQQPDAYVSLDVKLNDLLKTTICSKENLEKLNS